MSFLDHSGDLSETSFTQKDLSEAKAFWLTVIQEVEPSWLKKPKGEMGRYWLDNSNQAMTYLVLLGQILHSLSKCVIESSKIEFQEKIKQLLRLEGEQYISLETEFLAMKVLSQKVTPLKLKPLVPEHLIGSSNEPRSPDLSINLPSCEIFCEITVLQVAIFNEWDKTIDQFVEKIGKRILDKGGRRVVGFRLPMDFRLEKLSNREANILVEFILETNDGYLDLFLQNCDFYLDWTPLPHVDTHTETVENITWPERTPFATFGPVTYIDGRPISGIRMPILPSQIYQRGAVSDPGYIPAPAYTIIVELVKEDLSEQILKSLRNTLKLKRSQFSLNEPYLLIMTIGHHRIPTDVVLSLIVERIWNNPDYDWMSGICMFKPGDLRIGQPGHIMLVTNPKAINPVPPELVKVFENEQEFHSL